MEYPTLGALIALTYKPTPTGGESVNRCSLAKGRVPPDKESVPFFFEIHYYQ